MLDEVLFKHLINKEITEVTKMQITKINNISFRENVLSREMDSQNAILMLRDPNASVKFQQNQEFAQKADTLSSNPIKALGYKLYRTFSMLKGDDSEVVERTQDNAQSKRLNLVA